MLFASILPNGVPQKGKVKHNAIEFSAVNGLKGFCNKLAYVPKTKNPFILKGSLSK
jgi:hypothetical protein